MRGGASYRLSAKPDSYYSLYLLAGDLAVEGHRIRKDTFARISDTDGINVVANEECDLFMLRSPVQVPYPLASGR